MIINILGHGLQWVANDDNMQEQEQFVAVEAPNFASVHFYCDPGIDFDGPDARQIVNDEWVAPHHVFENANHIPEHFIVSDIGAWNDILRQENHHVVEPLPEDPRYTNPNILHLLEEDAAALEPAVRIRPGLRIRRLLLPQNQRNEIQVAIQAVNAGISLSWLIHYIPNIIQEHPQLANLFDGMPYTYRWLACRNFINGLDPDNNENSRIHMNDELRRINIDIDWLFWEPGILL